MTDEKHKIPRRELPDREAPAPPYSTSTNASNMGDSSNQSVFSNENVDAESFSGIFDTANANNVTVRGMRLL
jgi:hypothetical protein